LYEILRALIDRKNDNPISEYYLKTWYNASGDGVPDIGGYTLIYLKPPVLSGLGMDFSSQSKNYVFLAQEFTPPDPQILNSDIQSTANIKIPYGVGKSAGGQLSISFIENHRLDIYSMHHTWLHYIEDVILGNVSPTIDYIISKTLDYATCAYIIKYKPDLSSITYIGKAIGIFPTSVPVKEIIGSRNNYQLTIFSVNYICTDYQDCVLAGDGSFSPSDNMSGYSNWVIEDFQNDVYSLFDYGFSGSDLFGIGSILNPFKEIVQDAQSIVGITTQQINSIIGGVKSAGIVARNSFNSLQSSAVGISGSYSQSSIRTIGRDLTSGAKTAKATLTGKLTSL